MHECMKCRRCIFLRHRMHSLLSGIERSSWHDPLPEWGRCKMSNGHWLLHLTHRTSRENQTDCSVLRFGAQFPLEIILLPHSHRGSHQLLLSRTDTFVLHFLHYVWDFSCISCISDTFLNKSKIFLIDLTVWYAWNVENSHAHETQEIWAWNWIYHRILDSSLTESRIRKLMSSK